MKKSETDTVMYTEYNDQFLVPAVIMFILLVIDVLLMDRKNHLLRRLGIIEKDVKVQQS
jgi:Ca-activated chloride channel family protein